MQPLRLRKVSSGSIGSVRKDILVTTTITSDMLIAAL